MNTKARESVVQNDIRLAAQEDGVLLLRQNSGALLDQYGRLVRFGLANESKQMNKIYKSGDLIGIVPVKIGVEHVGMTLGVFLSVECKQEGWRRGAGEREEAQARWAGLVLDNGGRAGFASSVEEARLIWK